METCDSINIQYAGKLNLKFSHLLLFEQCINEAGALSCKDLEPEQLQDYNVEELNMSDENISQLVTCLSKIVSFKHFPTIIGILS